MDVIDAAWIKARLTGKRGEKAALARALRIAPEKVSRILVGERDVQPAEVPRLLHFFGETDPEAEEVAAIMSRLPEDGRDRLLGRARSLDIEYRDSGPTEEGSSDPDGEGDAK